MDFSDWYAREHPKVLGALCALTGNADASRDATDEAFVRALSRWQRVQRMQSPSGWTFRVALNVLRRDLRQRGRDRSLALDSTVAVHVPATDPELWMVVRGLPDRQRTAIVLRYVADLAEAEIAMAMKIKRGTVSATLAQARVRLGELLADDDDGAEDNGA